MNWKKHTEHEIRVKFSLLMFLCSIIVVYGHATNFDSFGINASSTGISYITFILEKYGLKLATISVYLFYLISGILFFKSFKIKDLLSKWKNRFSTIVVPYCIWCTLYYFYLVLCSNLPFINSLMNEADKVSLSIHEWINSLWINKYYTLWFLQNLIVFIILTPIIFLLLNNHKKNIKTGLIILLASLIILTRVDITTNTLLGGIETYLIGCYIGLNCREYFSLNNKLLSIISAIYVCFTLITSFTYLNLFTEFLFFLALWYALDLINLKSITIPWWMNITFFTYVAHDVILVCVQKVIFIICGSTPIVALLDYIFTPLLVLLILIFVAYFMQKKLPIAWKILTGGR